MENQNVTLQERQSIHALVDTLPDEELRTALRFMQFLAEQREREEAIDREDGRLVQEALVDPARHSLESVLKEASIP